MERGHLIKRVGAGEIIICIRAIRVYKTAGVSLCRLTFGMVFCFEISHCVIIRRAR